MTGPATSPAILEKPSVPGQLLVRASGLSASYSTTPRARLRHWSMAAGSSGNATPNPLTVNWGTWAGGRAA
eukprot:13268014-Alexandrium_andersonii.AAC.1